MKFKNIIGRLTGFSIPVFGVSWSPPELEIQKAKRIISFLEDRRVLYNPETLEVPDHCVHSVNEIRSFLTNEISSVDSNSELSSALRAMRSECRKFLDNVSERNGEIIQYGFQHGHWASWRFLPALGELRGVFGVYIAKIATSYGLDVEKDLASILPEEDKEDRNPVVRETRQTDGG
jgi:hypothetical protein